MESSGPNSENGFDVKKERRIIDELERRYEMIRSHLSIETAHDGSGAFARLRGFCKVAERVGWSKETSGGVTCKERFEEAKAKLEKIIREAENKSAGL